MGHFFRRNEVAMLKRALMVMVVMEWSCYKRGPPEKWEDGTGVGGRRAMTRKSMVYSKLGLVLAMMMLIPVMIVVTTWRQPPQVAIIQKIVLASGLA
jgi:hypothetical protein